MTEKKNEAAFIPCGDSMEKMQQLSEDALESVSGGLQPALLSEEPLFTCPACGHSDTRRKGYYYETDDQYAYLVCTACGHKKINGILC